LLFIFLGIGGAHFNTGDMIAFVGMWLFGSALVDLVQASTARSALGGLLRERAVHSNIESPKPVLPAATAEVALR